MRGELPKLVIVITVVGLIFWDIAVAILLGQEATVSRVLLEWSREHPAIPFAVGAALSRIFWSNNGGGER